MRNFVFTTFALALLGLAATEANAQVSFGAHASWASEVDLGIGGVKFPRFGKLVPFGELRYGTAGAGQIYLTGGVTF